MNNKVIVIGRLGASTPAAQARRAEGPAGRSDARWPRSSALLGDAPRRADLLIEHLHQLQDRFGRLLGART